jgi:hypothetical protein
MGAVMRKPVQGRLEKRMRAYQELQRTQTAPASTKVTTSLDMNDTIVLLRLRLRAEAIDESGPNPRLLLKAYGQGSSKRLAVEDFGKMVRRHGFQEATDADLTRIFKQIDANKDGVLSADEMHTFLWPPVDMVQGGKGISSEIMEGIAIVKRKFQAASYVGGGQDFKKLWVQINVDEGAYMEYIDFAAAVRRHGVSAHLISDKVLERIFESIFVTMSPERRTAGLASGVPGKEGIDQVAFEKFMSTNGKKVQHYAPVETVFDKMMQRSRMGGALRRWRDKVWDLFDLRELMAKMMANASRSLMRNMFLRWERNARRIDKLQAASEVLAKSHQLYAKVAALNVVKQVKSIRKEIDELKVHESDDIVGLSLRHQKDMEAMRTQAAAAAAEARAQMEELQEQLHTAQHEANENRTKWRQLEAALKDERDATAADTQEREQAYRALQMQKDDAVDKANQLQDSMSALEATFTGNLTKTSLAATIADKQAAHDKSEQLEAELRELRVAHEAELQTLRSEMSRSDTDYSRQHEEGLVRLTELQRLSDQHKREADQQIIEQQLRFKQNVARRLATEIARASHGLLGSSFWVWQNEAKVAKRCKAAMNRFVLALSRRTLAMAWNSWFDLYRMHVRRMRQLEQVTRIWIRSGTSKAWYAWCYASVRWRRLKRIMGQLGASAKIRRTYIAFDIWKTTVIRDGKTRAMLGKSVSGLIDRNVLAALRTWKAETSQARRAKALLERAITRIACLLLSQAFSRWTAYVYERCRLRLICTRALTRLTDTLLATAFNSWKLQQSATASHKKRLLWAEKFVSTIQQRVVASAFSGWHDSMCKLQRGRTIATRALKRMRDIHLYEAIVQWRGNVVEIRRRQMLLDSMVRRLRSKTLWYAWFQWVEMHIDVKATALRRQAVQERVHSAGVDAVALVKQFEKQKQKQYTTMTVVMRRMSRVQQRYAFKGWHYSVQATQLRRTKMKRAVRFMQKAGMAAAFGGWTACTAERVHNRRVLQKAATRLCNNVISRALDAWVEFASTRKHHRCVMSHVAARVTHGISSVAFDAWYDEVQCVINVRITQSMQQHMLSKVVGKMTNRRLGPAFSAWYARARHARRCKAILRRSLAKVSHVQLARAYTSWDLSTRTRQHHRIVVARAVARLKDTLTAAAFGSWKIQARATSVQRQKLRWAQRFVATLQHRTTASAFAAWHKRLKNQQRVRNIVATSLARICNTTLFKAWSCWQERHKVVRRRVVLLDRAVHRFAMACVASAFDGWASVHELNAGKKRSGQRAVRFMQKAGLAAAFGGWTACTAERVHNRRVLQKAATRLCNRVISRAVDAWV